jgi:hypothetical protein
VPPTTAELFDKPIPGEGHFEAPFFARIINGIKKFWLAHWQWIIGTFVAIVIGGLTVCFTYLQAIKK